MIERPREFNAERTSHGGSLQELRHIPRCNPLSGDKTSTARIALLAGQRPLVQQHTRRNSVRQRAAQSSVRRAR